MTMVTWCAHDVAAVTLSVLCPKDVNTIMEDLKTKEPRVWVRSGRSDSDPSGRSANPTTIAMHPFALRPSELTIPAERIVGILQR
jgi:hypothetical protein